MTTAKDSGMEVGKSYALTVQQGYGDTTWASGLTVEFVRSVEDEHYGGFADSTGKERWVEFDDFTQKGIDKKDAVARIADSVQKAYDALREAEALADEYDVSFQFSPAYGMGGYYDGREDGWNSSSNNC